MKSTKLFLLVILFLASCAAPKETTPTPMATFTPDPTATQTFVSTPTITPAPTEPVAGARIVDSKGIVMAYVPSGIFIMGSNLDSQLFDNENPMHKVYLDAYYIDIYEVTNQAYQKCVREGGCHEHQVEESYTRAKYYSDPKYADFPLVYVATYDAIDYCAWRGARLPTEAEWEKAARGTDGRTYPWGEQIDCSKANYNDCHDDTNAVGSYEAGKSPYGVYDMAGNVWEFVSDYYYNGYYYKTLPPIVSNPLGPATPGDHVIKGGAWFDFDMMVRSSVRAREAGVSVIGTGGFRCAWSAQ